MYLRSISLKGFKSFPDRTRLDFAPGVSVIVGPNGSGKSNITDAVLWALGEQSPLAVRGQTMQDVIFSGSGATPSRSAAEVEVVIDNSDGVLESDFAEISIARRLDRSGEGEYRLNGARCRLIDVLEVLSDTGLGKEMHSVVSQGRVEAVVHSRPQDRRMLVEEAAGLGKHRKRRRRAELKLARTADNLARALDLEREARSRLRPLKRQAQAAELHERIERQTLEARMTLVRDAARVAETALAATEAAARSAREARAEAESRLQDVAARREAAEQALAESSREREERSRRLFAATAAVDRIDVRLERVEAIAAAARRTVQRASGQADRPGGPARDDRTRLAVEGERLATEAAEAVERASSALAGRAAGDSSLAPLAEGLDSAARLARGAAEAASRTRVAVAGEDATGAPERSGGSHRERAEGVSAAATAAAAALRDAMEAVTAHRERLHDELGGGAVGGDAGTELRALAREEADVQARLRDAGEEVTRAEVAAQQARDAGAEVRAELEALAARLGLAAEPGSDALGEDERAAAEAAIERLERRRAQLGPVNPLAAAEYEEARARVQGLETQREDLESALAELERVIAETDRRIRESFDQTFAATARNFEQVIEDLFPGGRGRLRLVTPDSPRPVLAGEAPEDAPEAEYEGEPAPADPGVEVEVTPAGKSMRRLSLLSGGEKSLVALAFLFAVFLARPCPFYVLDEVEAALDDRNIDRFLRLVRRCAEQAQFIVVTHQKRTMDAADRIYGVSMAGDGVSKVVSRRLTGDLAGPAAEAAEAA